jgi:NAD-dependent deacetylase
MTPSSGDTDTAPSTQAAEWLHAAHKAIALTGAGISVGSGIPDFRSPGGLWTVSSPEEYATLEVFHRRPAKAWELFRALGKVLLGKQPNPAHRALAQLEQLGLLQGIVTQNIDNLHQQAGSNLVFEIHGDHQHLHCLRCQDMIPVVPEHYQTETVPHCAHCGFPLKPNVVLFGEAVRDLDAIHAFIADCDLLLVIGTSAQVYPAAALPSLIRQNGGRIIECNHERALSAQTPVPHAPRNALFLQGDVVRTLPQLVQACRQC